MPVTFGSPPVTWAIRPGKESDGNGVLAELYSRPRSFRPASTEFGWVLTYQARSCWCRPSTEISSTCLIPLPGRLPARLAEAEAAVALASAAQPSAATVAVATATATLRRGCLLRMIVSLRLVSPSHGPGVSTGADAPHIVGGGRRDGSDYIVNN